MLLRNIVTSAALLVAAASSAIADKPAKEMICGSCHGAGGAAPIIDSYPKLNGQNKAYMVQVLKAYRAGERKGGMSAVMVSQASSLTDAEIEALAAYYAAQP